jgi:hypothetical protein
MTTPAEGWVDLGRAARRFRVVPHPDDRTPVRTSEPPGPPRFGPFAGQGAALDLESLAERLGPVLEQ